MYLVDTNIWLELLLKQDKAEQVNKFFKTIDSQLLNITEFSLYSIGIIMIRLQKEELFRLFLLDIFKESNVGNIRLDVEDFEDIIKTYRNYKLDFDDSYQYVAAKKYGLTLVSFDSDFDHTDIGRKTPEEILEGLQS